MAYSSKKLVYGKGVKGNSAISLNGRHIKAYATWRNMLMRCYNSACHKLRPTYIGCSVSNEWLYFPTFKEWFDANYVEGWHLDKDLLLNGNKIYSPDTCIFAPRQINLLFTDNGRSRGEYPIGVCFNKNTGKFMAHVSIDGKEQHIGYFDDPNEAYEAYLIAKKSNVIRMANEWREKIQPKLYDALIRKADELTNINNEENTENKV